MSNYETSSGSGISISVQSEEPISPDFFVDSPHSVTSHSSRSLYSSSPNSYHSDDGNLHQYQHPQVPSLGYNHASPSYVEGSPTGQNYFINQQNIQPPQQQHWQQQQQQQQQHHQLPFQIDCVQSGLQPKCSENLQLQQSLDLLGSTVQQQLHIQQQFQNLQHQPNHNTNLQCTIQNINYNQTAQTSIDSLPKLVWKIPPTKSFRYRYLTEKGGHGFLSGDFKNPCPKIELQNFEGPVEFRVSLYKKEKNSEEQHSILRILQESDVRRNGKDPKDILKEEVIFNGRNSSPNVTCELRGISIIKLTKEDLQRLGKDLETAASLVRKFNSSSVCLRVEAINPLTGLSIASPSFSRCITNDRGPGGKLRIHRRSLYTCPVEGNEELWILTDTVKKNDIEVMISDPGSDWQKKCNNVEVFHQHTIICRIPPYDKERITEPSKMNIYLYRPSDNTSSDPEELKYKPSQDTRYKHDNNQYQELFSNERVMPQSCFPQQQSPQPQSLPGTSSPPITHIWKTLPSHCTGTTLQHGEELIFSTLDRKRKRPNSQDHEFLPTQTLSIPGMSSPPMAQGRISPSINHTNFSVQQGEEIQLTYDMPHDLESFLSTLTSDLTTDGTGSEIKKTPVGSNNVLATSERNSENKMKLNSEIASHKQETTKQNAEDNEKHKRSPAQEIRSINNKITNLTIHEYDDEGHSALHTAILNGSTEKVSTLLSHGANVNLQTQCSGDTPLIIAVKFDHGQIIQLILDTVDVDIFALNCAGETAMDILENGSEAIQIFQSHMKTNHLQISTIQQDKKDENYEDDSSNKEVSDDYEDSDHKGDSDSKKQISQGYKCEDINDTEYYKKVSKAMKSDEISNKLKKDISKAMKSNEIPNKLKKDNDKEKDMDAGTHGDQSINSYFYWIFPIFLAYYFMVNYYNKL